MKKVTEASSIHMDVDHHLFAFLFVILHHPFVKTK